MTDDVGAAGSTAESWYEQLLPVYRHDPRVLLMALYKTFSEVDLGEQFLRIVKEMQEYADVRLPKPA